MANNKLINIRTLRGSLLTGSFPFGSGTLQTRPESAFSFKVLERRGKPSRKNGEMQKKKNQTNKKSVNKYATKTENWISNRNRFGGLTSPTFSRPRNLLRLNYLIWYL